MVQRRRPGGGPVLRPDLPDSSVTAVRRAPGDFPSGKQRDVLTVEFTVLGIPCIGLNGGPAFKHTEAFSFQVAIRRLETENILAALKATGGKVSGADGAAELLGLRPTTLASRIKALGIGTAHA